MDAEMQDPREGVLEVVAWLSPQGYVARVHPLEGSPDQALVKKSTAIALLADKDAEIARLSWELEHARSIRADPLRAMPDGVRKALEAARREFLDVLASCDAERVHHDGDQFHERLGLIESALSKLQSVTPTDGGMNDGE